jgi:hypothetical protein
MPFDTSNESAERQHHSGLKLINTKLLARRNPPTINTIGNETMTTTNTTNEAGTMTRKQAATVKNIRNEWLADHKQYEESEATVFAPSFAGEKAVVVCTAAFIGNGQRFGQKSVKYTVGVRGKIS